MPPGPPSACSVCVRADRPQNTINVPCQWQPSLGTQQSSGVLLRWRGCGPWRRRSVRPLHVRCCRLIHNRAQRIRTLCSFSLTRSAMTFPVLCEPQMCLLNSFCLPTSARCRSLALASRNCVCTGVSAWRL